MTGTERITSITQIREMTANEIADAHSSGRIDLAALTAEAQSREDTARDRGAEIRSALQAGSIDHTEAQRQLDEGKRRP